MFFFLQGQGKVREFCKMVRELENIQTSGKSRGILKSCFVQTSQIEQNDYDMMMTLTVFW